MSHSETWEYRVTWINPTHGGSLHAQSCKAEWEARQRARDLVDGGMANVRMERRPVAAWTSFGQSEFGGKS